MKIQPLNNNILCEVKKFESVSGIILSNSDTRMDEAEVIAVSKEIKTIKVKDIIFLKNYSTDEIEVEGRKLCFIKGENVLGRKI